MENDCIVLEFLLPFAQIVNCEVKTNDLLCVESQTTAKDFQKQSIFCRRFSADRIWICVIFGHGAKSWIINVENEGTPCIQLFPVSDYDDEAVYCFVVMSQQWT